jgi:hypothetical protein
MKVRADSRKRVALLLTFCALLAVGLTALAGGGATVLAALPQWEPVAQALGLDQFGVRSVDPAKVAQQEAPTIVDFGGAPNAPVAGLDQWVARQNGDMQAASGQAATATAKKIVVLRVYFNDYANASRYDQAQVTSMMGELNDLLKNTSYNNASANFVVSTLFQLPSNRSAYIDDSPLCEPDPALRPFGDLSCDTKYMKVLNDAVANAPSAGTDAVDFSNTDAVFVVMAETDNAQFHRGQANKCGLAVGVGGANKTVGCAIFSENPSETDRQVWGRWAHESGHAFQSSAGPAHPSNYNSEFELMDSNYPGQTGVFEKSGNLGFPGWMPAGKYVETSSDSEGGQFCLWAMEYDPTGLPNPQAIKAKITNSLYYMISVRRRVLGDDLNGGFPSGIPDEGVLIERVSEGSDPWVVLKAPPGGTRDNLWKEGQNYDGGTDGIVILVNKKVDTDGDHYCVTVRYNKQANQPDMGMYPWTSPPGNTWETTDIWVDSPVNGYGTFRYGSWNDLSGNAVPRGNGDNPAVGMANRLYARVRNFGTAPATDIVVRWEITDPPGRGIAGANGWLPVGSVDKNSFPALAALAPGAFTDVYVDWTPNFPLTNEQIAAGDFNFHTCVRVKIDTVAGELVLGNQNGDREQENIDYFQAVPSGGNPTYDSIIRLRNDDLVNKKFFSLTTENDLPAAWVVDVNHGEQGVWLDPGATVEIPVIIKPQGPAVVGSIFGVDVYASSLKLLANDMKPEDKHPADDILGGVRVESRVLLPARVECEAIDNDGVVVTGLLKGAEEFLNGQIPLRVMVQGVDGKRKFIDGASAVIDVNKDGSFQTRISSRKERIEEVVCLFAGTDMLASAGSGYERVRSDSPSPLPSPTRTPLPTYTPTATATPIPSVTATATATPRPLNAFYPINPVLKLQQPLILNADMGLFGIEITQGIQCFDTSRGLANCPDNSLPVALGKMTAARVYMRYSSIFGSSRSNTPVRLYMSVNNGPWQQANTLATARPTLDQSQASNSANFIFTIGGNSTAVARFYAEVDPSGVVAETNEGNNRYPSSGFVTMTFRQRESLKIISQPLDYHPAGYGGTRIAQGWAVNGGAANWFNQLLPIRNGGINHNVASGNLDWTTSLGSGAGQHELIQRLNGNYALLVIFGILFGQPQIIPDHIYGWAPNSGYSGGHADMPVYPHAGGLGVVGIGTDRVGAGPSTDNPGGGTLIFGHELVHDYDERHTNTADGCGSNDGNSAFPYGSSSIQEFGFNPATQKVYDPATTHDLMSYCPAGGSQQGWISPYTWTQMFNSLATSAATAAEAAGAQGDVIAAKPGFFTLYRTGHTQSVIVNLSVDNPAVTEKESGKLGNLYQVDSGFFLTLPEGDYAVELRGGQQLLASHPFTVSFESEYHSSGEGHSHAAGSSEEVFDPNPTAKVDITLVAPWVDGTTSIALVYKGQTLDERIVSGNSPTVEITEPVAASVWQAGETQKLSWKGDDPDQDTLHYAVFYSHNAGQNWQLLASELSDTTLEVAVDSLAGGIDTRFRVVATDGVNTGMGETPNVIEVPNKAPMPVLLEPSSTLFAPDVVVVLRGSATDLEDGSIPEDKLVWSSDVQGELGKGYEVAINTLTPGPHTLTLTAMDSNGLSGSVSVSVFVGYGNYLPAVQR